MTDEVLMHEFEAVGKYRIRLVRNVKKNGPVMLDVREYIEGANGGTFSGFTRRGIRIELEAMKALRESLDIAIRMLEVKL